MTPAAIIKKATADGVNLTLSASGTIKAIGNQAAVIRWLPLIREHNPGIVATLREAANDDTFPDPAMQARPQRVLAMLAEHPGTSYAVIVDDPDSDPVILTLAVRDAATVELQIPIENFDPFLLLDLIGRHGGTMH